MTKHTWQCIDSCIPLGPGRGWLLRGWWIDASLQRFVVEHDGKIGRAWRGTARPDLVTAYPETGDAAKAGLIAHIPGAGESETPTGGYWWVEDLEGNWRRIPADWSTSSIRALETLSHPMSIPPAEVVTAAAAADDPEFRLETGLQVTRGLTLRLDIINKCNLRCVMCHYSQDEVFRRPARSLTPEQFEDMFASIAPAVGEIMLSCADEPLMSPHFSRIVELVRRLQPRIVIRFCSNAMLMTAPIRRVLVEQQVNQVLFSMDGCSKVVLESIRVGARYERIVSHILALDALKRTSQSRYPDFAIDFVMMQRNLHESIPFVKLARRIGATMVDFRHVVDGFPGFSLHQEQLVNTPGRFDFYREKILEMGSSEGMTVYIPPAFARGDRWAPGPDEPIGNLKDFEEVLTNWQSQDPVEPVQVLNTISEPELPGLHELFEGTFCSRPFSEIMVRNQNEVLPCPWHREPLGHLDSGQTLAEIFHGERFQNLRRNMLKPEGDHNCRICPLKSKELPSDKFT